MLVPAPPKFVLAGPALRAALFVGGSTGAGPVLESVVHRYVTVCDGHNSCLLPHSYAGACSSQCYAVSSVASVSRAPAGSRPSAQDSFHGQQCSSPSPACDPEQCSSPRRGRAGARSSRRRASAACTSGGARKQPDDAGRGDRAGAVHTDARQLGERRRRIGGRQAQGQLL